MHTYNDLARRYDVHVATIHRWRENGWLPAPLLMGPNTVRFREGDIEKFEGFIAERSRVANPDSVAKPDYSLPDCDDVFAMARERLASMADPASTAETAEDRKNRLRHELEILHGRAAILASQSLPGQLGTKQLDSLRANLSDGAREVLLETLPEKNTRRLEAILSGDEN